jgi:hypothetical protein
MIFHISTLWISFDPLDPSNIRGFQRFIWTHKHIISSLKKLGMKKNLIYKIITIHANRKFERENFSLVLLFCLKS